MPKEYEPSAAASLLLEAEIDETEALEAARDFLAVFPNTTKALLLLAAYVATEGSDEPGAEIIAECVQRFAEHEAAK